MSRQLKPCVALLLIAVIVLTGCHPTQPFYFREDGDLSHYLDHATDFEYPDVETCVLPDVQHAQAPLTISNPEFSEIWDITLEECISIALQNSKVIRNLGGVTPFGFADALVGRSGQNTIYDPAISGTGVEAALSDFDALFRIQNAAPDGSFLTRSDRRDNRVQNGFFPPENQFTRGGLRTDITKKTATGATFTAANQTNYERWDFDMDANATRSVRSHWTTSFEVRWDQPLLRGRGTQVNRIPIVVARINEDINLAAFESSVRNLVMDVENTYWDLHCAFRNLETAKIGRDSAQVTWKIVYEKWTEGVSPIQDEAQAREQYFALSCCCRECTLSVV